MTGSPAFIIRLVLRRLHLGVQLWEGPEEGELA